VLLNYDSGLRAGDLFTVKRANLRTGGRLLLICEKTQQPNICQLRPATVEALEAVAIRSDERLIPWPIRKHGFYEWWRLLLIEAGLPPGRRNGLQRVRRTAATLLERAKPGSATAFLGHRTGDLARKHYLDPLLSAEVAMPPELPEPPRRIEGPDTEDEA
jgi:integrase